MIQPGGKVGTSDVNISQEDQSKINTFSRINMQLRNKQTDLKSKKDLIDLLDDATTELELLDEDEKVQMKFGDCFFHISTTHATEAVEKQTHQFKDETKVLDIQIKEHEKKLKQLKATLYSKFGNSINLEED